MLPGLGGMNPAQMKAMMRQFGIKSEELSAEKVTIELTDGKKIVFESPQVTAVDMKGTKTYTITGEGQEIGSGEKKIPQEDIDMVMEQTKCTEDEAIEALEANEGDLAEAIASLKK